MSRNGEDAPRSDADEPGAPRRSGGPLGVLDIGSQTTTLALFLTGRGRVRRAEQVRVALPLARHVSPGEGLSAKAVSETARVVRDLDRHARRRGCRRLLCVATSAVRDAANAPDVIAEVAARCGVVPEILDGRAEGEATGLAVTTTLPVRDGCFFDLGGGSLQIGLLRDGRCARVESFPLGALRMAVAHLRGDRPAPEDADALEERVVEALAAHPWFRGAGPLVGVGGTIRALAKVDRLATGWPVRHSHGYWLSAGAIHAGVDRLAALPATKRAALGVPRHRVGSVLSGALVIRAVLRASEAEGVRVCGFGLRDGVAYRVMECPAPRSPPRGLPEWERAMALADRIRERGRSVRDRLLTEPLPGWYQEEVVAAGASLGMEEAAAVMERTETLVAMRARALG